MGTKKKYFSTCRNWYKGSICGKKAVVLYECCPGYMKLEGMKGCPAVAPIDHVYGTLGLVKASTTQEYSDLSKLREEIEGKGSFTMFTPSNEAWDLLEPEVRSALVSNVNVELYNALHYHMVNRRMLTKDLKNDKYITSMYNNMGLYINHYSNGIVTVNCARIIHGNQVATNGVVHVIDRVITAVGNTIKDILEVNEDLSSFSAVASASGVMDKMGQPGHFTLFAPTNEAMENLGASFLERIMGDKEVIGALVNYHLLNSVQCSEAIMAGSVYETVEGSTIEIGCDGDSLTVNGIKMVLKKDIVTSNGVIHLIDKVLIPDSAKEVMELVGESQSTFSDMVSELGLSAAMKPETEYTLLAPLNPAFSDEVMSIDQSMLKVILENHILKLKHTLSELYNGQLLETISGKLLRVFIYRTAVCIENACMVRGSKEGSNGALHLMSSLIKPAQTTIYQLLMSDGRFNIFLSLMESAGLTELLKQEGSYTVFAPTDEAFDGLTEQDITMLTSKLAVISSSPQPPFTSSTHPEEHLLKPPRGTPPQTTQRNTSSTHPEEQPLNPNPHPEEHLLNPNPHPEEHLLKPPLTSSTHPEEHLLNPPRGTPPQTFPYLLNPPRGTPPQPTQRNTSSNLPLPPQPQPPPRGTPPQPTQRNTSSNLPLPPQTTQRNTSSTHPEEHLLKPPFTSSNHPEEHLLNPPRGTPPQTTQRNTSSTHPEEHLLNPPRGTPPQPTQRNTSSTHPEEHLLKLTRVIEGEPSITKVTRVIEKDTGRRSVKISYRLQYILTLNRRKCMRINIKV
uniref:Periostin n=1 Tax=Oncorhynchus kisutch TaxID=8019 RepID=A0A8C7HI22_ONCKI